MDLNKLYPFIFFVVLCLNFVDCNKLNKLERGINILKSKFSTLEQKLYNDEIELRTEIESLWESFNASNGNYTVDDGQHETTIGANALSVRDFDKVLRAVEDRSNSMLRSFSVEKAMIRENFEMFEHEFAVMKKLQESALYDFKNASNELLSKLNNSISDVLVNANNALEQQVANMKHKQEVYSVGFNASINERFADYEEAVNEQNNFTMESLEQSVHTMKVKHDNDFESLKTKAHQMLAGFKDTVDEWQERANITHEIADNKTYELKAMIETVKTLSGECTQRTDHIKYLMNFVTFSLKDWNEFGNSYYKLSTTTTTWKRAVEECKNFGAYLVVVDSLEENQYLAKMNGHVTFWLGGSDLETEGTWIWQHTKKPLSFKHWHTGEPNGWRAENCLQIKKSDQGEWNDGSCEQKNHYVCELSHFA